MLRFYSGVFFVMAATVAGCGSSTTSVGTPPMPLPAAPLLAFEGLAANPNSASLSSAATAATQTSVISDGVSSDGNIQLTVGTSVYDLSGSQSGGAAVFNHSQGGTIVDVTEISKQTDSLLAFTKIGDGSPSDLAGYSVLGNRTPALELVVLGSSAIPTAVFNGTSHLVATREDGVLDTASGNLILNVDFGRSDFTGSMDMTSAATGSTNFEITTVNATVSGNIFADGALVGVVDVPAGNTADFPNGANQLGLDPAVSGTLDGALFGPNAQEAGGSFNFSGAEPFNFSPSPLKKISVQGGFLGKQ